MIRSYKYENVAIQLRLHEMILSFFNRIENETGVFDDSFFDADLLYIANRHQKILKTPCIDIFNTIRLWTQQDRSDFCLQIRDSNNIESICAGNLLPKRLSRTITGILKVLRELFLNLYKQVLDGDAFNDRFATNLRSHFDSFSKLNSDLTLCPICGIGELKKHQDITRDQYDHYLPQSKYPLSSVNFKNLVPTCKECNSFDVKGEKDILSMSSNKKLFFPYDTTHKGITVSFQVIADNINIEHIVWGINYTNPDNKLDEVISWKNIYDIDNRYQGFVKARIEKWYRHFWNYMNSASLAFLDEAVRAQAYDVFLELDEESYLNFIRRPALNGFLSGSLLAQAEIQAKHYSN